MQSQGLLFSEPSVAETGVWCELSNGIDPADWARICRYIGTLSSAEFEHISAMLIPELKLIKNDIFEGIKRLLHFEVKSRSDMPIVSIGPGKPGDVFQWEI